ncbi:MAG: hypothetical protein EPN17_15760 [Methylobacter sp.]|nr:MAG: hypothetical protein EPN17_15760 [Methylobacter sp.]
MFSIPSQIIDQILLPSFLRFLFIGGGFSLAVGIGLIFHSELMFRVFEKMNRWVSSRRATRILEIPRDCWPLVQRYRYLLAFFITAGSVYALIGLITQVDTEAVVPGISRSLHLPGLYVSWILISVKWFLLLGCVLATAVGLMLGFSLTTLLKIESLSGRWISLRNNTVSKKADVLYTGLDKLVVSFPKTAGWIITILALIEVTLVGMRMY